jgi:class 3 adenylate cyclase
LEDFLIHNPLTIDGILDDGWGEFFPVKGIELKAAVLIVDMGSFSRRTADLLPVETLIFVNNFLAWITAESIRKFPCVIDRYVGDSVMVVFSEQLGSTFPIEDALRVAKGIAQNDALAFSPHMGIAFGDVIVGYTGTPTKFSCSVFGRAITLADRCSEVIPPQVHSCSIAFPASLVSEQQFREIFGLSEKPDQALSQPSPWRLLAARSLPLKNIGNLEVREIIKVSHWYPCQSAEDRTRGNFKMLSEKGYYRPNIISCMELDRRRKYSNSGEGDPTPNSKP